MNMGDGAMGGMAGAGGYPVMMAVVLLLTLAALVLLALILRRPVPGDPEAAVRAAVGGRLAMPPLDAPDGGSAGQAPTETDAFLVIPDISGYTRFMELNRFSLAHAQYVVSELLNSVIDAARGRLAAAKVEGDAVMLCGVCGPAENPSGPRGAEIAGAVVDILAAFYGRAASLKRENTCRCSACRNLDKLDLKVVVDFGRILVYRLRGTQELSGFPVIVAHRLLKNSLDLTHYVLVTETAHDKVRPPLGSAPRRHAESYADLGELAAYVYTFEPDRLVPPARSPAGLAAMAVGTAGKLRENARSLAPRRAGT